MRRGARVSEAAFDVLVVGGGLVGASLACALQGMRVGIVEDAVRKPAAHAGFDSRVYALSPGSADFLRRIGAWERMASAPTPVHRMHVHGDDAASLDFDAWEAGVAELAWIVEDRVLQDALGAAMSQRPELARFAPARCTALDIGPDCARVALEDGARMSARLVVGADGAASFVRGQAGIPVRERAYEQSAVVANFACEKPHAGVARQWFQGGPVLALLPLPGRHVSMVWSTAPGEASRLTALAPVSLCDDVARASDHVLGALSLVTPARAVPLRKLSALESVRPRVALAGDAAHVIHPLAGQGANLGFQDANALAAVLAAREPDRDPGEHMLLRRYERARAEAILAMSATVDGLQRLFAAERPFVRRARNAGMNFVQHRAVVKNLLIRQAMR